MPIFDHPSVDKNIIERLVLSIAKPHFNALEVGVFQGQTTAVIGKIAKSFSGKVCVVDWWKAQANGVPESYPGDKWENVCTPELIDERFKNFRDNMDDLGLTETIRILNMSSDEAATKLKDNEFDFIFIDAAHYYSQVKKDIEQFFPKLKIGGVFCGHDCERKLEEVDRRLVEKYSEVDGVPNDPLHYGVIKAVGETFKNYQIDNTIWHLVKKTEVLSDH